MASYKDLKKEAKALSLKAREGVSKDKNDGSLACQIAVIAAKVDALKAKKDKTSLLRKVAMKKQLKDCVSNYRRLDRESALELEKKLGL